MFTSTPARRTPLGSSRVIEAHHVTVTSDHHRVVLTELFDRLCQVSTLPQVANRVLMLVADPHTVADDLRSAIQEDPALAANVLRRVNSSFFALSRKVGDLRSAISLLGFAEIRNICLSVFVARMFQQSGNYRSYRREKLWEHCAGVAVAARMVARLTNVDIADEAYAAGLLHHLGSILIDQHLHSRFCRILDQLNEATPNHIIERRELSFSQAQLGEFVTRRWNFPAQVTDAIGYYQYPDQYSGSHRQHVYAVAVANYLCAKAGWTSYGVLNSPQPPEFCFRELGMDPWDLGVVWDELRAVLPNAGAM